MAQQEKNIAEIRQFKGKESFVTPIFQGNPNQAPFVSPLRIADVLRHYELEDAPRCVKNLIAGKSSQLRHWSRVAATLSAAHNSGTAHSDWFWPLFLDTAGRKSQRSEPFASLGKGRWQASDGMAYMAAAEEVLRLFYAGEKPVIKIQRDADYDNEIKLTLVNHRNGLLRDSELARMLNKGLAWECEPEVAEDLWWDATSAPYLKEVGLLPNLFEIVATAVESLVTGTASELAEFEGERALWFEFFSILDEQMITVLRDIRQPHDDGAVCLVIPKEKRLARFSGDLCLWVRGGSQQHVIDWLFEGREDESGQGIVEQQE